jgi:hypothetical protein
VGLCVVTGLGHGIKYIKVTTNPVELWASPDSRSRVEREYFDSHFEPFYRTEQVIIRASGYNYVSLLTFISILFLTNYSKVNYFRQIFILYVFSYFALFHHAVYKG